MPRLFALAAAFAASLTLAVPASAAPGQRISWSTDLAGSLRQAEQAGRPLLVLVTANPCGRRAPIGDPGDVHETDCEALESRTLSAEAFVEAAARFVPVVMNVTATGGVPAHADFIRARRIGTVPALLILDPWGNEVIRMLGPTPADRATRVLRAVPQDLLPLRAAGEALRADPERLPALMAAAAFYESAGVRPFAERYYERAASAPVAKADPAARRRLVIARGLNLLQMGQAADAERLFSAEAKDAPALAQTDVVLFGWATAALARGDRDKAAKVGAELAARFPDSAYTKRLQENLGR